MYWAALAACLRCYGSCRSLGVYLCAVLQPIAWSFWCFLVPYWTLARLQSSVGAYALYKPLDQARACYQIAAHTQRPLCRNA